MGAPRAAGRTSIPLVAIMDCVMPQLHFEGHTCHHSAGSQEPDPVALVGGATYQKFRFVMPVHPPGQCGAAHLLQFRSTGLNLQSGEWSGTGMAQEILIGARAAASVVDCRKK